MYTLVRVILLLHLIVAIALGAISNITEQPEQPQQQQQRSSKHQEQQYLSSSSTQDQTSVLQYLDRDIQLQLVEKIWPDKSILHVKATSKYFQKLLNDNYYGNFSKIGHEYHFIGEKRLCQLLKEEPSRYKQIRQLYVTYSVWSECEFNPQKLINLKTLYILYTSKQRQIAHLRHVREQQQEQAQRENTESNPDPSSPSSTSSSVYYQNVLELWDSIRSEYKTLKTLEVFNQKRESILFFILLSPTLKNGLTPETRLNMARERLESGLLNIQFKNKYAHSPLHLCLLPDMFRIAHNSIFNTMECLKMMVLNYKADVNAVDVHRYTPVHFAATLDDSESLKFLLDHGGNINGCSFYPPNQTHPGHFMDYKILNNYTPLHIAAIFSAELEEVRGFSTIAKYASYFASAKYFTDEDINFGYHSHWKVFQKFKNNPISPFKELIARGADQTVQSVTMGTVFNHIVNRNAKALFEYLIEKVPSEKLPLEIPDIKYRTPLLLAIENRNEDMALRLIDLGANIYAKDGNGENSYVMACFRKLPRVLMKLIDEKKMDINQLDERGNNCIQINYGLPNFSDKDIDFINILIQRNINLMHRSIKSMSTLDILLTFLYFQFCSFDKKENAMKFMDSILGKLSSQVNVSHEKISPFNPNEPVDQITAHFLMFVVSLTHSKRMFYFAMNILPRQIQKDVQTFEFLNKDMLFPQDYIHNPCNPYKTLKDDTPTYHLVSALSGIVLSINDMVQVVSLNYFSLLTTNGIWNFKNVKSISIYNVRYESPVPYELLNIVNKVLKKVSVETTFEILDENGYSILKQIMVKAIKSGELDAFLGTVHYRIFRNLAESIDETGETVVHWCLTLDEEKIGSGARKSCIEECAKRKTNMHVTNKEHKTPLDVAFEMNDIEMIDILSKF